MQLEALHCIQLPNISVRILAAVLRDENINTTPLLNEAGIPPQLLNDPDGTVTGEQELAFQFRFAAHTQGRPDLWIKAGMHYRLMSYGLAGLISLTAPNLRTFALSAHKTNQLHYSLSKVGPCADGDFLGLCLDFSEVPEAIRDFVQFRDIACAVVAWRDMWTFAQPLARVCISAPRPPGEQDWFQLLLGTEVEYDAPCTAWFWPEALERIPFHGDTLLHDRYLHQRDRLVEAAQNQQGLVDRLISGMAAIEGLTLGQAAKDIGMSERTLQRQLARRGLSFNELQNVVKTRKAKTLLISSRLSISEVAWRLGYADGSSFSHAFQRWTGRSPKSFRRATA